MTHQIFNSTYEGEGPKCPYCGRQFTADEAGYYEPRYTQDDCDECGETFEVEVIHDTHWRCTTRDSDTHPKDGDSEAAPLGSGVGRKASPEPEPAAPIEVDEGR
jgi:hypothetical protein